MNAIDILIDSSDSQISQDLHQQLTRLGFHVIGVTKGDDETLASIESLKPDLIITDVRLSQTRGGIKTWNLIYSTYNIPVIYLMGQMVHESNLQTKTIPPYGYIFLPCDNWQLLITIEFVIHRHQLETKLRENRQWLDTTLTCIGEGLIATDPQGIVRFINPTAIELTGWSYVDAVGSPLLDIFKLEGGIPAENLDIASIKKKTNLGIPNEFEALLLSRTGHSMPTGVNASLISADTGKTLGMVLVFRDLTQQRRALLEISRQANRAESLVQAASQFNRYLEQDKLLDMICTIINKALKALCTAVFLLDEEDRVFKNPSFHIEDENVPKNMDDTINIPLAWVEELISPEKPAVLIQDLQDPSRWPYQIFAQRHAVNSYLLAGLYHSNSLTGLLLAVVPEEQNHLIADDLNLLQGLADQASGALRNAKLFKKVQIGRERQRKLAKSLVDIQEAERRHIAKDLHDHLGQVLTGLQFMLENVKDHVGTSEKTELSEIQTNIADVIVQVREMSLNLRPSMLDDRGLLATLTWHFARYTGQTGIKVMFRHDEIEERMPGDIETAAYRIIQEALTNVAKYAEVKEVFVGLTLNENKLWLEILDEGNGFDVNSAIEVQPTTGIGGMRERANMVGGIMIVRSYKGQGTQIVTALPISNFPIERRKYERKNPSR